MEKNNTDNKEKPGYGKPPKEFQWKPGQSGNPGGRPKSTLKDYDRRKFNDMSDQEKEKFLKTIAPELRYRMAEGNPTNEVIGDINIKVEKLGAIQEATKEILNGEN